MQKTTFQMSRRTALGSLGATLVLPSVGFAADLAALSGHAFGTTWRLTAAGGIDLAPLAPAIEDIFARVDRTFSPWRADSSITRLNAMPADAPVQDTDLADVTMAALSIAQQSNGAFDPTVGPLVAKWGFGPIHEGGVHDWRGIEATQDMICKTRDDLTLDLCGIAKGWALDRAAEHVRAAGVANFLFEIGGEFTAEGQHPDGRDWRLSIDTPLAFAQVAPTLQVPSGSAVATSGLWEQSYRLNERLYSHIIDTGNGMPVSGTLRSVTVVSGDAMMADGWATALCAAGAADGPALAGSADLPAVFLIEDDGMLVQVATDPMLGLLL